MGKIDDYMRRLDNPKEPIAYPLKHLYTSDTGHPVWGIDPCTADASLRREIVPPVQVVRRPGLGDKIFGLAALYVYIQHYPEQKVTFSGLDEDTWLRLIPWVEIGIDYSASTVVNLDNCPINGGDRVQLMGKILAVEVEDIRFPINVPKGRPELSRGYFVFAPFAAHRGHRSLPLAVIEEILRTTPMKLALVDTQPYPLAVNPNVTNLAHRLTTEELIRLIHHSEGVIGADSGVIFLAAAMGKPTLCFFGHVGSQERCMTIENMLAVDPQVNCGPCGDLLGIRPACRFKEAVAHCVGQYKPDFCLYVMQEFTRLIA